MDSGTKAAVSDLRQTTWERLEQARLGNQPAYAWLVETYNAPLQGLIRKVTGCSAQAARDTASGIWEDQRELILRPCDKGGYGPDQRALFYSYVFNQCTDWGKSFDKETEFGRELPLPVTEEGESVEYADEQEATPAEVTMRIETLGLRFRAFCFLLELVFAPETGYPHQQLAFAFAKILWGKPSSRGLEGNPTRLHERHGRTALDELATIFWREFELETALSEEILGSLACAMSPLRRRLAMPVEQLMHGDAVSLKQHRSLWDRVTGTTFLEEYYPVKPNAHQSVVPDWCYKVEKKIRHLMKVRDREGFTEGELSAAIRD